MLARTAGSLSHTFSRPSMAMIAVKDSRGLRVTASSTPTILNFLPDGSLACRCKRCNPVEPASSVTVGASHRLVSTRCPLAHSRRNLERPLDPLSATLYPERICTTRVFASMAVLGCSKSVVVGLYRCCVGQRVSCRLDIAQYTSFLHRGAIAVSKVEPRYVTFIVPPYGWLARRARARQSSDDHRSLYSGPARQSLLGQSPSIICESVALLMFSSSSKNPRSWA